MRKPDLASLAGCLWFEALAMDMQYEVRFVDTKANSADGPSRDDGAPLEGISATEVYDWKFPTLRGGIDGCIAQLEHVDRLVEWSMCLTKGEQSMIGEQNKWRMMVAIFQKADRFPPRSVSCSFEVWSPAPPGFWEGLWLHPSVSIVLHSDLV